MTGQLPDLNHNQEHALSEPAANNDEHTAETTDPAGTDVAAVPDTHAPAGFDEGNPFTEADVDMSSGENVATAEIDNPYNDDSADAPVVSTPPGPTRERVVLPSAFHSIADQLPPQAKSKLKACDVTVAVVELQLDINAPMEPMRMSQLMGRDFASNCARRLGGGGWINVTVSEPKKHPWSFGFEVQVQQGQQADENPLAQQKRLLDAYLQEFRRIAEDVKLEASLSGGGGKRGGSDLRETLRELKEMGLLAPQQQQPAGNNLTELVQAMGAINEFSRNATSSAFTGAIQQKEMLEKLGVGKTPVLTTAQELKEVLEIPVVSDIAKAGTDAVVQRWLNPKDKTGTPEVTGEPGPISDEDNPFAETA